MGHSRTKISILLNFGILTLYGVSSTQTYTAHVSSSASRKCPCSKPQWCEPITHTGKEVFAFSTSNDPSHWKLYDWSKLTTLVMFGYVNESLMCLAHSHGVKVAIVGSVSNETFMSPQLRKKWIAHQINTAKQNYLDGINFDYESVIMEDEATVRNAYTSLVKETNEAFKEEMPYFQVTVDVAWKPNIDLRFYDYVGLAENSDFLFVMAYDEQSQIFGECLALPNSGLPRAYEDRLQDVTGCRFFDDSDCALYHERLAVAVTNPGPYGAPTQPRNSPLPCETCLLHEAYLRKSRLVNRHAEGNGNTGVVSKATVELSSEGHTTVAKVIPLVNILKKMMASDNSPLGMHLHQQLQERFKIIDT
ncbi:hypothetical protein RRG08_005146 [Elysia crispata]|uniref:GH18 domain-containing protein n=1 Tax=Elysia crispata TaxID=231223 RepID=A0AAE1DFX7_9GAST|nr:hypothetical protein RRG08_005146 [Elysia crispata]